MKSNHSKKDKRDLKSRILIKDLRSFEKYLANPHFDFYSASSERISDNSKVLPEHREVSGEYLETDPEIEDIFSHQVLSKKDLRNRSVCIPLEKMSEEQEWTEWWDEQECTSSEMKNLERKYTATPNQ